MKFSEKNYFLPGKLLGIVENLYKWGFLKIKVNEKIYFGLILLKSEKLYLRQNAQKFRQKNEIFPVILST
jgi:hypothetical protein